MSHVLAASLRNSSPLIFNWNLIRDALVRVQRVKSISHLRYSAILFTNKNSFLSFSFSPLILRSAIFPTDPVPP